MTDTTRSALAIGALAASLILATASPAGAQMSDAIARDARVRVDLFATERSAFGRERAQTVVGRLADVRGDAVLLRLRADADPVTVPMSSIRQAYASRGRWPRWQSALRGAIVPALIGGAVSALSASVRRRAGDPSPARMALSSAAWSAATGAALGAWAPRERWRRVSLGGPSPDTSIVSPTVVPPRD